MYSLVCPDCGAPVVVAAGDDWCPECGGYIGDIEGREIFEDVEAVEELCALGSLCSASEAGAEFIGTHTVNVARCRNCPYRRGDPHA